MSATLILLSVIGGSIALLVLGVITLMVWESNSRKSPSVQSNPGASLKFMKYSGKASLMIATGVALLIASIWFFKTNNLSNLEGLDTNLWIAVGILVALAVAGALKKGGTPGTVALVLVVGGLLLFGADAPNVLKKAQTGASSRVFSESKSTAGAHTESSAARLAGESKVVTWSEYNQDGSIPIGVRSEEFPLHDKCTLNNYPQGYGHTYVVWLFNEDSARGWVVQKYGSDMKGHFTKYAVEVLMPNIQKGELRFIEVCPYTLPKE